MNRWLRSRVAVVLTAGLLCLTVGLADQAPPPVGLSIRYQSVSHSIAALAADSISAPEINGVFGLDTRTIVAATAVRPFSMVVFLLTAFPDGQVSSCSGFMIGPRTVGTAGHCVYSHDAGGWAERIVIIPAANGKDSPFGWTTADGMHVVRGWKDFQDSDYDFAAIDLSSDLGSLTGTFGLNAPDDSTLRSMPLSITGYPAEKPYGTMWQASGSAAFVDSFNIYHQISVTAGDSGGPVWTEDSGNFDVVGITSHLTLLRNIPLHNVAVRINPMILDVLRGWVSGSGGSATPPPATPRTPPSVVAPPVGQRIGFSPSRISVAGGRIPYATISIMASNSRGNLTLHTSAGMLVADAALTPNSCTRTCVDVQGDSTQTLFIPSLGNDLTTVTVTLVGAGINSQTVTVIATQSSESWLATLPVDGTPPLAQPTPPGTSPDGPVLGPTPAPQKRMDVFVDGTYPAVQIVPARYTHQGGGPDCVVYKGGQMLPPTWFEFGRDGYGQRVRLPAYDIVINDAWGMFGSNQCGTWRISE